MSNHILHLCWPLQMPPVPKAALIALADASDDGGVCWLSVPTISKRTCYTERAIQKALRWLEAQGLMAVDWCAKRANKYTLCIDRLRAAVAAETPANEADEPASPGEPRSPHPRTTFTPPVNHVHPNPKGTLIEPIPPNPLPGASGSRQAEAAGTAVQASAHQSSAGPAAGLDEDGGIAIDEPMAFSEWLDELKGRGMRPVPADGPVWDYADAVGLHPEMVRVHWWRFKAQNAKKATRRRDWPGRILESYRGNWYRLWFVSADGDVQWTSQGMLAHREMEASQ